MSSEEGARLRLTLFGIGSDVGSTRSPFRIRQWRRTSLPAGESGYLRRASTAARRLSEPEPKSELTPEPDSKSELAPDRECERGRERDFDGDRARERDCVERRSVAALLFSTFKPVLALFYFNQVSPSRTRIMVR